jgi:hypothetical protein
MKHLDLVVTGDTQRDIYHALRSVTAMVDEEYCYGNAKAPGFSFSFKIEEDPEPVTPDA